MRSSFFFLQPNGWMNNTSNNHKKREHKSSRFVSSSPVPVPVTVSTFAFLFAPNWIWFLFRVYAISFLRFFRLLDSFFFVCVPDSIPRYVFVDAERSCGWRSIQWSKIFFIEILFHFYTEYTFASIEWERETRLIVIPIVEWKYNLKVYTYMCYERTVKYVICITWKMYYRTGMCTQHQREFGFVALL